MTDAKARADDPTGDVDKFFGTFQALKDDRPVGRQHRNRRCHRAVGLGQEHARSGASTVSRSTTPVG